MRIPSCELAAALRAQLAQLLPVPCALQMVLVLVGPVQSLVASTAEHLSGDRPGLCLLGVAAGPHDDRTVEVPAKLRRPRGDIAHKLPARAVSLLEPGKVHVLQR